MSGKERVLNAFNHKESDFVPIGDQLIVSKVASEILGRYAYTGGGEFAKDKIELLYKGERDFLVERYVEDTIEIHEKLGLDFIRVDIVPSKNYSKDDLPKKLEKIHIFMKIKKQKIGLYMSFLHLLANFSVFHLLLTKRVLMHLKERLNI